MIFRLDFEHLAAITDVILSKIANIIGGEDAVKIVMTINELGKATGDQLMALTEMKLNDIRKILFKLYNQSLIQCDRSRDQDTGWFIFEWRLQPGQIEGFIKNLKSRILRILKTRLKYEENNTFYYCNSSDCKKVIFEDALEFVFKCPICKKLLQHYDNSAEIKVLSDKIKQVEIEED